MKHNINGRLRFAPAEQPLCCLCGQPILESEARILLYQPGKRLGYRTGRAHLACFEKHPIQNLNLMKKDEGLTAEGSYCRMPVRPTVKRPVS